MQGGKGTEAAAEVMEMSRQSMIRSWILDMVAEGSVTATMQHIIKNPDSGEVTEQPGLEPCLQEWENFHFPVLPLCCVFLVGKDPGRPALGADRLGCLIMCSSAVPEWL